MYYVYILIDPKTREIRWVGQTSRPRDRFRDHLYRQLQPQPLGSPKAAWILSLRRRHLQPDIEFLYDFRTLKEAEDKETEVIEELAHRGEPLLNVRKNPYIAVFEEPDENSSVVYEEPVGPIDVVEEIKKIIGKHAR